MDFQSNAISFLSCGIFFRAGHPPRCSRKEGLGTRPWEIRLMQENPAPVGMVVYPIIEKVLYIPGGARFCPSTGPFFLTLGPWSTKSIFEKSTVVALGLGIWDSFPGKICYKGLVSPPSGIIPINNPSTKKGETAVKMIPNSQPSSSYWRDSS